MSRAGGVDTLWIVDSSADEIRKVDVSPGGPSNWTSTRVVGIAGGPRYGGDGGPARNATLRDPEGVWVAADGTIYLSDGGNNLVRKVDTSPSHIITTIGGDTAAAAANASNGTVTQLPGDSSGDGGPAVNAHLDGPRGVTGDNQGRLYVAEDGGARVRRINLGTGLIETIAGDGTIAPPGQPTIKGENGPALGTEFDAIHDIQIDPADASLWVADAKDNRVRAISDPADAPGAVMPGVPGAPTSVSAARGNGSATVSWAAPSNTGGSAITGYRVTSSGGQTVTVAGTTLTATVGGLTNGTAYTFTVHATNGTGASPESAASNPVTPGPPAPPASVPDPPQSVTATGLVSTSRAAGVAAVSWSAPSDGGSPIGSYRVTASPGGTTVVVAAPSTNTIVSNLQNGTSYTFTVQAQNSVGASAPSVPSGPAVPYCNPAPVRNVAADLHPDDVVVRWETPADDGGRPITGYRVSAAPANRAAAAASTPGPVAVSVGASQRSATLTGLVAGTEYAFTVVATNEAGDGPVDPTTSTVNGAVPATPSGYWMVTTNGKVYPLGVPTYGDAPTAAATHIEAKPAGTGYWVLAADGTVYNFGAAPALGNATLHPGERAVSLSATPTGAGYWVFTDTGRAVTFGDAVAYGDMAGVHLNGPILGSVATPDGRGYWMVGSDGGIFAFGDAAFHGSTGGMRLNKPVMAMAPATDGSGYWLVASDGGIFAFDVPFYGSMGATRLNKPISGMVPGRGGYMMVAADGGIFSFGNVAFHGSLGANPPNSPVVGAALQH